ncbi:hypothetical protein [Nocardia sp. XZ_19_385]|uniref:hypothetical protein n=1 Tax=Nocardia sp. XZ_19_385 TaxID=2769488 RepID=UPI00188E01D5|nr:hypothetical protein [Nocardia sp. XZ_19_385]
MDPGVRRDDGGGCSIELRVVSGDMIDGTTIVLLLERRDPDAVAARKDHGELPTIGEFAVAVAEATTGTAESGHTVYVGGADYLDAEGLPPITAGP